VRMGPLTGSTRAQPIVHIGSSNAGGFGLDHEAQCVSESLPQNRRYELFSDHPSTGGTSRPQCLQTRALASIGSAQ
jgi:hypothetical protein